MKSIKVLFDGLTTSRDLPLSNQEMRALFKALARSEELQEKLRIQKEIMAAKPESLSILFCNDVTMRSYQKKFRHLNKTTDILSFPSHEVASMHGSASDYLGDLIVSLPAVQRGARRGARSFKAELMEVLIHGFLHLLGYDHVVGKKVSRADAKHMRELQARLYRRLKRDI